MNKALKILCNTILNLLLNLLIVLVATSVATSIAFFVGIGLGTLFVPNAQLLTFVGILIYTGTLGFVVVQQLSSDHFVRLYGALCSCLVNAIILVSFYIWHLSGQGANIETAFLALVASPFLFKYHAFGPVTVVAIAILFHIIVNGLFYSEDR